MSRELRDLQHAIINAEDTAQKLKAENKFLRQRVTEIGKIFWLDEQEEITRLRQRVKELEAELAEVVDAKYQARKELRKDADRWQKHWPAIRDAYKYMANESDNAELHAAIDAAMEAEK